jgi:hypothetical protein
MAMIRQFSAAELRYNTVLALLPSSGGELGCEECGVTALSVSDFAQHIQLIHLGLDVWSALNPKYGSLFFFFINARQKVVEDLKYFAMNCRVSVCHF